MMVPRAAIRTDSSTLSTSISTFPRITCCAGSTTSSISASCDATLNRSTVTQVVRLSTRS